MSPRDVVRNHVRRLRRERDWTQQDLAERLGVTRQTIVSIEGGRYNPSVGLALRIAEAFGLSVEQLFEVDPEENNE